MTESLGRHRDLEGRDSSESLDTEPLDTVGRPLTDAAAVTRHEDRAEVGTELHESGRVRVRKHVDSYPIEEVVSRRIEHADDSERVPAPEGDSGEVETLEDGSVSIPIFEEVLVVTKRLVVRERVIVRKRTTIDEHRLQTELRREHVSVDTEGDVNLTPEGARGPLAMDPGRTSIGPS
jgi:uncharacterized protein (TIGR02271 family)